MIGKFLSAVTKVVTVPVDIVEIGIDLAIGGGGSRNDDMPRLSDARDAVCEALEEIDD